MRRPSAFSLVELLVVIAIIALLLCMLLPTLSQIDRMKKETICQHNLADIGKAFTAYATMNDGRYPYPVDHYYGNFFWGLVAGRNRWAGLTHLKQLRQAGLGPRTCFCPFDPSYDNVDAWPASTWKLPQRAGSPVQGRVYIGYALLAYRGYPYDQTFTDGRSTVTGVRAPDDVPIAADNLHYRTSGTLISGWHHGGGRPDGVFNSACNTLFKAGYVVHTDASEFDWNEPAIVVGSARDLWWFALQPK